MSFWTPTTDYPNQFILTTMVGGVRVQSEVLSGDVLEKAYNMALEGRCYVSILAIEHVYEDLEECLYTPEGAIDADANRNLNTYHVAFVTGRWNDSPVISTSLE